MMTLVFDGILLLPKQNINIFDIEKYLYEKTDIPMKISIKPFEDFFTMNKAAKKMNMLL